MKIKILMDADCLIKLTKSGAKEAVISAMEVHIPAIVKKETVDDGKKGGYQDSLVIEKNINNKGLYVVAQRPINKMIVPMLKGESAVLSLYLNGDYYAVASDDKRFLKKLETANIPFLTPTACIIYLFTIGHSIKSDAMIMLEKIRPFISGEEYRISKYYLEGKT